MFLVQVPMKATQAYPGAVFAPIPQVNPPNDLAEKDRVAAGQAANQVILDVADNQKQEGQNFHKRNAKLYQKQTRRPKWSSHSTRPMYIG